MDGAEMARAHRQVRMRWACTPNSWRAARSSASSRPTGRRAASPIPLALDVDFNKRAEFDAGRVWTPARSTCKHPRADEPGPRHHRGAQSRRQALRSGSASSTGSTSTSRAASAISAVGLIDGPNVRIKGRVGWSCGENMLAGTRADREERRLDASAPRSAAATWSARAMSARAPASTRRAARSSSAAAPAPSRGFMMQRGRMVILGDAGKNLGDSMYDGTIYVGGKIAEPRRRRGRGRDDRPRLRLARAQADALRPRGAQRRRRTSPRSSPASSSGTTTTSSRPKRSSCSDEEDLTMASKPTSRRRRGRRCARKAEAQHAACSARAASSRRRSSTTSTSSPSSAATACAASRCSRRSRTGTT